MTAPRSCRVSRAQLQTCHQTSDSVIDAAVRHTSLTSVLHLLAPSRWQPPLSGCCRQGRCGACRGTSAHVLFASGFEACRCQQVLQRTSSWHFCAEWGLS